MKQPLFSALLALTLATACTRSQEERSSRIGQSTYDPSEELTPASRTTPVPDPSIEQPLDSNTASTSALSPEDEEEDEFVDESEPTAGVEKTPDVIYVPTPQPIVDRMLQLARVTKDDIVYDLGCGDGRIVVTAAKRYGARAIGFDVDPARITEARANVRKNKVEHLVTIEQKDIFTLDLSPASVITLYLLPTLNNRLLPQLEQLSPGARVVSHDYDIDGVVPVDSFELQPRGETRAHSIFFYTVPFQRERKLSLPPAPVRAPVP